MEGGIRDRVLYLFLLKVYRTGDLRSGGGSDLCRTFFFKSPRSGRTETFGHLSRQIYYIIENPSQLISTFCGEYVFHLKTDTINKVVSILSIKSFTMFMSNQSLR